MAWIESHSTLIEHSKVREVAKLLDIEPVVMVGHLTCLWHKVIELREDGDISQWTDEDIAYYSRWTGNPKEYYDALKGRFIDEKNGLRLVHNWLDYVGKYLESKYRNNKPKLLKKIWRKHNQKYNKVPGRPVTTEWLKLRKQILERDKYICQYCGKKSKKMHIDHVIPVSKGGSDNPSNLVASCAKCNMHKGKEENFTQGKPRVNPVNLTNQPNLTNQTLPNHKKKIQKMASAILEDFPKDLTPTQIENYQARAIVDAFNKKFKILLNYGLVKNCLRNVNKLFPEKNEGDILLKFIREMPLDLKEPAKRFIDMAKAPGKYLKDED